MCGGGGAESQTVNQVRELPDWAQPYAEALLQSGMESLNQLPQQYTGMRIAPMNMDQNTALGMISGRATQGAPDEIAARQQATSTLAGDYLNSSPAAQYQTQVAQNPFMGANPYLQQYVQQGMQDMAGGYATGVAAQTDAAASRNNMYGGSAYQEMTARNAGNLAKQMSDFGLNAYMQDYGMQQQLAENAINRGVQAQQFDAGLQSGAWDAERNRQIGAIDMGLQGSLMDYTNAQNLLQSGNIQNAYTQQLFDQQYQDWYNQMQAPYQQIDRMGNLLNMAVGNAGTMTSTQQQQRASNPFLAAAFGGLTGYGMTGGYGGAGIGALAGLLSGM